MMRKWPLLKVAFLISFFPQVSTPGFPRFYWHAFSALALMFAVCGSFLQVHICIQPYFVVKPHCGKRAFLESSQLFFLTIYPPCLPCPEHHFIIYLELPVFMLPTLREFQVNLGWYPLGAGSAFSGVWGAVTVDNSCRCCRCAHCGSFLPLLQVCSSWQPSALPLAPTGGCWRISQPQTWRNMLPEPRWLRARSLLTSSTASSWATSCRLVAWKIRCSGAILGTLGVAL